MGCCESKDVAREADWNNVDPAFYEDLGIVLVEGDVPAEFHLQSVSETVRVLGPRREPYKRFKPAPGSAAAVPLERAATGLPANVCASVNDFPDAPHIRHVVELAVSDSRELFASHGVGVDLSADLSMAFAKAAVTYDAEETATAGERRLTLRVQQPVVTYELAATHLSTVGDDVVYLRRKFFGLRAELEITIASGATASEALTSADIDVSVVEMSGGVGLKHKRKKQRGPFVASVVATGGRLSSALAEALDGVAAEKVAKVIYRELRAAAADPICWELLGVGIENDYERVALRARGAIAAAIRSDGGATRAARPDECRLLLAGKTGQGKSTLSSMLLGKLRYNPNSNRFESDGDAFPIGHGGDAKTNTTTSSRGTWFGHADGTAAAIVDTPGLDDPRPGADQRHIKNITDAVVELRSFHAIVIVLNGSDARVDGSTRMMLRALHDIFDLDIYARLAFLINRWDPPADAQRARKGLDVQRAYRDKILGVMRSELEQVGTLVPAHVPSGARLPS